MKNKIYILVSSILFILLCVACLKDDLELPADRANSYTSFSIQDARAFFEENALELEPLIFKKKELTSKCTSTLPSISMMPEWNNALVEMNGQVQMVEVLLQSGTIPYAIRSEVTADGKTSSLKLLTFRRLVVAKLKSGQIQMYMMTLVPDYGDMGKLIKDPRSFRYLGGSDFSGLVLYSGLNGHFIEGYRFDEGRRTSEVYIDPRPNGTEEGERRYDEIRFKLSFGESVQTRSGTYGATSEPDHSSCPECHGQSRECLGKCLTCETLFKGTLDDVDLLYCHVCHERNEDCLCCPACQKYPCVCPCVWCGFYPCRCCPICHITPCQCPRCQYCGRKFCYGTCQNVTSGGVTSYPDKEPPCPTCHKSPCQCVRCPYCLRTSCNGIHDDCDEKAKAYKAEVRKNYDLFSSKKAVQTYGTTRPSFQDFLNTVANDPTREHSTCLKFIPDRNDELRYYLESIEHGTANTAPFGGSSSNVLADIHSHPPGSMMQPSAQDIMAAAGAAKENPVFEYLYVHAQGDTYALYIENKNAAAAFFDQYPNCVLPDNTFDGSTKLGQDWKDANDKFPNLDPTSRIEHIIAYVLNQNNTGIKFLKKGANDQDFKTIDVKKDPQTGYISPVECK